MTLPEVVIVKGDNFVANSVRDDSDIADMWEMMVAPVCPKDCVHTSLTVGGMLLNLDDMSLEQGSVQMN